jgi:formiminotetrahydrofolate cyclodeaminase
VASTGDLLDLRLRAFIDTLAGEDPAPAAGAVAAVVVAMAAALVSKVARASVSWEEAAAAVAQAERLRKRVVPLAQADADAYEEALAAMHLPEHLEPQVRDMALGQVLERAAEIPLVIAEAGADAATLAADVVERGAPSRRADAVGAAILADAGTRVAAYLVAVNLVVTPDDERVQRAHAVADLASKAARNAVERAAT